MTEVAPVAPVDGRWAPVAHRVVRRWDEAGDVATLRVAPVGEALAPPAPGQFHMVWAFGVGDAPISVSAIGDGHHDHTVAPVGAVSTALASAAEGTVLGLRGPFGTAWQVDPDRDRHLLVVAGGIGMAPVRPVVEAAVAAGRPTTLVLGARTPSALLYEADRRRWVEAGATVHTTVDQPEPGWAGAVGLVTAPLAGALADPATTDAVVCGPEVMIRVTAERLVDLGVAPDAVQVSLERNMHCALGQCGRCQLGPLLLCRDGAVVRWTEAAPLMAVPRW